MINTLAPNAKAIVSAVVCAAAYLAGVIPAEGSLGDVSASQWLGLVIALGTAFGVTYSVPNSPTPETPRRGQRGAVDNGVVIATAVVGIFILLLIPGLRVR